MTCESANVHSYHMPEADFDCGTGGGKQGFQTPTAKDSLLVDGVDSALGTVHSERGLTYYEVVQSGHMIPQFSPWVSAGSHFTCARDLTTLALRRLVFTACNT